MAIVHLAMVHWGLPALQHHNIHTCGPLLLLQLLLGLIKPASPGTVDDTGYAKRLGLQQSPSKGLPESMKVTGLGRIWRSSSPLLAAPSGLDKQRRSSAGLRMAASTEHNDNVPWRGVQFAPKDAVGAVGAPDQRRR